jgi:YVTN family beta-propeller protein
MKQIYILLFALIIIKIANAQTAYVTNAGSNSVSVVNVATNSVTATITVGNGPYGVSVSPDGSKVYVANSGYNGTSTAGSTVSVINASTNTVSATITVGIIPRGVAISPDGSKVYVANSGTNTVSVINSSTNTVSATITVGNGPDGLCVSPDGSTLYVANYGYGGTSTPGSTVSVINTSTNTVTATIGVGTYPHSVAVSPDGSKVYVTNNESTTVRVINTTTNTLTNSITVGAYPAGVSVSPDGSKVYVANQGSSTVSVINSATNNVTATITVGGIPQGVSVSPDGSKVYVANRGSNTISVINTATNTVSSTIPVGTRPVVITMIQIDTTIPDPAGVIDGLSSVCQGQNNVEYTVPTIANATSYVWSLPNGATGTSTTNSISVNYSSSATSGNITVYGTNSNGDGEISSLPITVNTFPLAAGIISGNTNVCQGQTLVNYSVPGISNAISYEWTLPIGATGSSTLNGINVNYGASAVSGNITVRGYNSCGYGSISTLGITVNTQPLNAGAINGLSTLCQGQNSIIYTVPLITNATSYIWTLPLGATGSSITNSITVNYGTSAISGDITVKGHNTCGDGTSSTLAITVNPLPTSPGIISGLTSVCQGQTSVTYSVPQIVNATSYVWTLPSGATGTSDTSSIIVSYGSASGNITVKGNNACGDGATSTLAISVNPIPPTPTISLDGNILHSDALIGNQWYSLNGIINNATLQDYTVLINGDYYVIVTLLGCSSGTSNTIHVTNTGVDVVNNDKFLKIYPNPVSNELIIEMEGNNEKVNFELLNAIGQVVFKGNFFDKTMVQTNNFAPGTYLLKLENGKTFEFKKIIKK